MAIVTIENVLTRSAQALGYLGRTEALSSADYRDALSAFQSMLDSWVGENLISFAEKTVSFSLIQGQQTYTIGNGGYVNVDRPVAITQAFLRDTNNVDYPIKLLPQDLWNNIGLKNITSQIPDTLFYDPQFPLGIINIFPIPLLTYTVFLFVNTNSLGLIGLTNASTTVLTNTTAINAPFGYTRAFIYNLAVEMIANGFPAMLGQKELAALTETARESKANIKRLNITEVISQYDPAIVSRSAATYNVFNDSYPRAGG